MSAGAVVCDLCGTPVAGHEAETPVGDGNSVSMESSPQMSDSSAETPAPIESPGKESEADSASDSTSDAAECDTCGHLNPADSRYCNRCGSRLVPESNRVVDRAKRDLPAAPASEPVEVRDEVDVDPESTAAVGKQVIIVVSAALLLVMALYVVTTLSGGSEGSFDLATLPAPEEQAVEPLAAQWEGRESELKAAIEDAPSGEAQIRARRELIDLYFAADRLDFAGEQTAIIAAELNSEQEWIVSGNLYFDWMQRATDVNKAPWARKAIESYQAALALNEDNHDVRTDMAIAYLYDPQNSMMAIQETQRVLAADSMHVQANFNRGIMLSQINRNDQAVDQFEKVKRIIGDPEDPIYQRAVDAIARLSER